MPRPKRHIALLLKAATLLKTADLSHAAILPVAAFLAVLPLILRGCSCGHDFDFHLISWFETAKQFSQGTIHPHWAFTPAWNAGEPRFVFYPPLSWAIGGILGLLMPWPWTPIVYTWLALTLAGFAMHYSVSSLVPRNAALIASCIYLANPYTLYTAYERTAYAELLAAAWLPLALHSILRQRVTVPRIALPIALLWLTNAPAAVMGSYLVAGVALLRLALAFRAAGPSSFPSRLRRALTNTRGLGVGLVFGFILGLGMASFYIIPAVYEQRFVQITMAILPGLSPQENFLFRHTADADHDAVLHSASVLALVLLLLTAAVLALVQLRPAKLDAASQRRAGSHRTPPALSITLISVAAIIAFMLTPLSSPFWSYLPELRFLQFPWRLLAILAVVFAFGVATVLSRISRLAAPLALAAAAILTALSYTAFHQRCYPEDTLPAHLTVFRSANPGTDPTDEYTPVTADNDALAQANPGYWLANDAGDGPPQPAANAHPAPLDLHLTLATPQVLVLNLRDYPAWSIRINDTLLTTRLHRDDGLIALQLPAGQVHLHIRYAILRDQQIGYVVSSISLLLFATLLLPGSRRVLPPSPRMLLRRSHPHA